MKTSKIIRKPKDSSLTDQLIEANTKNVQVVLGKKSLRPMKSMLGIKSLKPLNLTEQLVRRK